MISFDSIKVKVKFTESRRTKTLNGNVIHAKIPVITNYLSRDKTESIRRFRHSSRVKFSYAFKHHRHAKYHFDAVIRYRGETKAHI